MTALTAFAEAHPWWTLVYLLLLGPAVRNMTRDHVVETRRVK